MTDLLEIQSTLHAYKDFRECVVTAIRWRSHGTTVVVAIDYIWNSDGSVRGDHEERLLVDLEFGLVQELRIRNGIPTSALQEPEAINWGLNEIASVTVEDDEWAKGYSVAGVSFHHASFRREGRGWIDIIFSSLEMAERSAAT